MKDAVERILDLASGSVKESEREKTLSFLKLYLQHVPREFFDRLTSEDLLEFLLARQAFLEASLDIPVRVELSRPTDRLSSLQGGFTTVETRIPDCTFIVRTLKDFFRQRGLQIYAVLHPVVGVTETDGVVEVFDPLMRTGDRLSHIYLHVSRVPQEQWEPLRVELEFRLHTLIAVNEAYQACLQRMAFLRSDLKSSELDDPKLGPGRGEIVEFMDWLKDNNFIFLGYAYFSREDNKLSQELGILDFEGHEEARKTVSEIAGIRLQREDIFSFYRTDCMSVVKSGTQFRYLGVRDRDPLGVVRGEHIFVGLLSSNSLNERNSRIPIIAGRMRELLLSLHFRPGSYAYKKMFAILNSVPNEGLFYGDQEEIRRVADFICEAESMDRTQVLIWRRRLGSRIEIVCVMPRVGYSEALKKEVSEAICSFLEVPRLRTYVRESDEDGGPLRMHFYCSRYREGVSEEDLRQFEKSICKLLETWEEQVCRSLIAKYPVPKPGQTQRIRKAGGVSGVELWDRFGGIFSARYRRTQPVSMAVRDIESIMEMEMSGSIHRVTMDHLDMGDQPQTLLRVISGVHLILNDIVPILEHMGLRAKGQLAERLVIPGRSPLHVASFECMGMDFRPIEGFEMLDRLAEIVERVLSGWLPDDRLLGLGYRCELDWQQVGLVISYRNYFLQLFREYAAQSVDEALLAHPLCARILVDLFEARFCLDGPESSERLRGELAEIESKYREHLDQVTVIAEDVILRQMLSLVCSTVRTNYFRPNEDGILAFKIDSRSVESMPRPRPRFEIFVSSPRMEGIHLRGGMVARGGLRASDRVDDYRTEVLGLMKTQMTKNSIIVPVGSKGGFIVRDLPSDRAQAEALIRAEYRKFIFGLLDITDNRVAGEIVPPENVVRYDGDDPYLVVAADKGTARFSDTANEVSEGLGFWLGDAFASGGSEGYDHKVLGITARGGWVSVERHFRELGVNLDTDSIRVVGVGDMSGDVFGNGLLRNERVQLVAAFNHMHIFLDPDPDPGASFKERQRLFDLPRSGWTDYDPALISEGGGIFERNSKQIELTPAICQMLGVEEGTSMSGPGLIQWVLKMEADLLWLGGIGTYVKAATELNHEVGDKANDAVRINAPDLRFRVVGEGANLGFTARARTEFCLAGGRCNSDAVDNSAGVDCSDHEVNLKIFMTQLMEAGVVKDREERNRILQSVEGRVSEQCLRNNYLQTALLSLEEIRSCRDVESTIALLVDLEERVGLDRSGECIPSNSELRSVVSGGRGVPRNVLAVLVAYVKNDVQARLLETGIPDHPFFEPLLLSYFPEALVEKYPDALKDHQLRREIVAMVVANTLVNQAGSTFLLDRQKETMASLEDLVLRYFLIDDLLDGARLRESIHALDNRIPAEVQYDLLLALEDAIGGLLRWWNWNESEWSLSPAQQPEVRELFREGLVALERESASADFQEEVESLVAQGVDAPLAQELGRLVWARRVLGIVSAAGKADTSPTRAAQRYRRCGEEMHLDKFEQILAAQPLGNAWEKRFHAILQRTLSRYHDRFLARELTGSNGFSSAREKEILSSLSRSLNTLEQTGGNQRIPLFILLDDYRNLLGEGA